MLQDSYTKALRRYDKDLFATRNMDGVMCVFRKHKRFELVCYDTDFKLLNLVTDKQFVFALTENWTLSGKPRMWGIEYVLDRIKAIDLQANERLVEDLDEANAKVDESKRRSFRNEAEAFWADNRREFAKAVDEFTGCTHTISKDEPRKRLKDRSIRNGNH